MERSARATSSQGDSQRLDSVISLRAPGGTFTPLAVEARPSFTPRDVDQLLPGLARSLRALAGDVPLLLVAPWLSDRSRQLLAEQEINFLDLTGNALVRLEDPALFIQSNGSSRNPQPAPRAAAGLRGPKAGRLVRLLADVRPPYGVRDLALAGRLTPGYVSRLLESLDQNALIERERRGQVAAVDVPAILRAWAQSYDTFKSNGASSMLAPDGASSALKGLSSLRTATLVTGSFAAVRWAPVAAPALLAVYCEDAEEASEQLKLLPADEGANVVLLQAFDEVVWERSRTIDGLSCCAPSQVAVDCLAGNGRMPAEGEALLGWMAKHESLWRSSSLARLTNERSAA